ncbi:ABC transporter permease [Labrys wisconsinensis]|uniref:Spermidine/putrescine transport system permease protein n=1 Tax=Labrys wisconsinensis TaxID=425677 RepID=A0ABU0J2I0_9HYPH|nr:ABC transporter permease [Labrys wisconsinensis]MDQ0467835.1 spermidine/putrescine transport system permease protein [Labrys wisconsinensis]
MTALLRRYGRGLTIAILGLTAFWLLALVVLPYFIMFRYSFRPYLPVDQLGGPNDVYTLGNYATFFSSPRTIQLFGWAFDIPIHVQIFVLTVFYSCVVTVICLVAAYPLAYFLAKMAAPRNAPTLFIVLLIPLWVSEVLRSFAWFIILSFQGPLNTSLIGLGLIARPVRWLTGFNGVVVGLVYTYVLFMLFPIYNAIQSLDSNQIEAAQDLGSPTWRTHWRVVIPHSKPGIASGCVMVFMLSAGSILVPTLLASTTSRWFTEIVQQWMFESQDWNTGSAYAFLLLLICVLFVSLMMRLFKVRLADIAK